jgi:hypothetical protein
MRHRHIYLAVVLLFVVALNLPALAQSDRGAINGTVVDPSGAAIAKAQITATNKATGETRRVIASDEGNFLLPEVKASNWTVKVEAQGFKSAETTVQVPVAITRTISFRLEVGAESSEVTVTAEAPALITESPVLSTNVTERQVKQLPIEVSAEIAGRTPLGFIFLDSNVTSSDYNNPQGASTFRVNGGQALGTEILIDGANTRRAQNGSYFTEIAPGPDAFQEFTYITTQYSAEYGNSSSGVVNFTLKSGTNKLHGEVYEYLKNEALNANSWNNNFFGFNKDRDREHDFGGNIGGPVFIPKIYDGRNKTFFFFNYSGFRFSEGQTKFVTVPTAKMRTGDFSEVPNQIYDPHMDPAQRAANPIPGNRLDLYTSTVTGQPVLDPIGMNILRAFPTPTRAGIFQNYLASTTRPIHTNSQVYKVDQIISDKQRFNVSYTYRDQPSIKGGFPTLPAPAIAAGVWDQVFKSHFARAQHDYTISNNILNHFNIGWNRIYVANLNSTLGFDTASLGFPAGTNAGITFPLVEFPGYDANVDAQAVQGIGSTWWNDHMGDNQVEISDGLTWVKGKHTLKFGADFRIQQLNVFQNFDNGGHFNFRGDQTGSPAGGGWSLASLATGATEWSWVTLTSAEPAWRYFTHSYYFNDDFKITPRLTLNLGVRYELQTPRTEAHDYYRAFDPNAMNPDVNRLGALAGAGGQGGVTAAHRGLIELDKSDFSPRFGFAYSLTPKTIVRGGMGLYYSPYLYDASSGILGYRAGRRIIPPYELNFGNLRTNAFLSGYPLAPLPDPDGQFIGSDVDYYQEDAKAGRTTQWSLDVQRELPGNMVVSLGYIGNKGTRLRSGYDRVNALPLADMKLGWEILRKNVNDLTAADRAYATSVGINLPGSSNAVFTGFNGSVAQALKPYPQYSNIVSKLEDRGASWYNAMNLKLDRRFSRGLQFGFSYTWSKLITTAGDDLFGNSPLNSVLQNPFDTRSIRALSPSNAPHVVAINYIYELPMGKGKQFLNNNDILDKIVGGWQVGGIHRYTSGTPVSVFQGGGARDFLDVLGYYGNIRPSLTGQEILLGNDLTGRTTAVLNPAAFTLPPGFAAPPTTNVSDPAYGAYYADPTKFFGNAPAVLNARVNPYYNENFSIIKNTRIKESMGFEFGAEFFNLFNRHRYAYPQTNRDTGNSFGTQTVADGNARRIQLRAKFTF